MNETPIHEQLWSQCLQIIANNVSEQHYTTWFVPIKCAGFDETTHEVTLLVPSTFFYEWIEEHFIDLLSKVLQRVYGRDVKLIYRVVADRTNGQTIEQRSAPEPHIDPQVKTRTASIPTIPEAVQGDLRVSQPNIDSHLIPSMTFSNFIEGKSNMMPIAVARSVAENPGQQTFNPLFIYGHSGVGKTHLANAIGIRTKQLHPDRRVLYVSAHLFQVQYVDATMRDNRLNDFIRFYQTIDVLIVDDVQEFQGLKGTLNAFFNIFNHLRMNGKQIILTCDRPPLELHQMEERMLTRFKWGLQCEIEQPDKLLRYNILKDKMLRNGLVIDDEVVDYLAENVHDSVRDLEGVLNSLMAHSVCFGREVDMDMAKYVVERSVRAERQPVTMDNIMRSVCDAFDVTDNDLQSSSRKASIVQARQVVMYLASHMTGLSKTRIGVLMGRRSHATVLHSIKQAESMMMASEDFREKVENLRGALLSCV